LQDIPSAAVDKGTANTPKPSRDLPALHNTEWGIGQQLLLVSRGRQQNLFRIKNFQSLNQVKMKHLLQNNEEEH
tara:strand:- start:251 stop:472 length:222 start_codon:yes stop_codon:yes gene_type:complete